MMRRRELLEKIDPELHISGSRNVRTMPKENLRQGGAKHSLFLKLLGNWTCAQTDGQTDRQTDRQTDKQTDKQTGRHRQKDRQTDRQTDKQTERQRDRQTHK